MIAWFKIRIKCSQFNLFSHLNYFPFRINKISQKTIDIGGFCLFVVYALNILMLLFRKFSYFSVIYSLHWAVNVDTACTQSSTKLMPGWLSSCISRYASNYVRCALKKYFLILLSFSLAHSLTEHSVNLLVRSLVHWLMSHNNIQYQKCMHRNT